MDLDGDGLWEGPGVDQQAHFGFTGATPLTADWNGSGSDKIGLFFNGSWFLDFDGDALWDNAVLDKLYVFGFAGETPIVGSW